MTTFDQLDFEATAQQVFDAFLVAVPHVPVEGLFRHENRFIIVVNNLEVVAEDGLSVQQWFDDRLRPLGYPIELSARAPAGAVELAARGLGAALVGMGVVRNKLSTRRDLALFLPATFPFVDIVEVDLEFVVYVSRDIDERERATLDSTLDQLGTPLSHRVEVTSTPPPPARHESLALPPARFLSNKAPAVRKLAEEDEDFWRSNYRRLFAGELTKAQILGSDRADRDTCLVGTTFPPQNLRSYLSLYRRVVLGFPLADNGDQTLTGLGVSLKELLELTHLGYVQFLAPQGIERYDGAMVEAVLEANPSALIGSRRLAAAVHADQLSRNPLFVLPGTAVERRAALRLLGRIAGEADGGSSVPKLLACGLAAAWPNYEYMLHVRGAMASIAGPLARGATELARGLTGKDYFIELGAAAQYVEWASAIGADFAPFESEGYSEVGHAEFLIGLHSGVDVGKKNAIGRPAEFEVAQKLLVIDSDVNVFDFVRELGSGDLARFRELVRNLARRERTPEELDELVSLWNSQIRSYERRPDRLKSMGLVGFALSVGAHAAGMPELVSISSLLLPALLTLAHEDGAKTNETLGKTLDSLNGQLANVQRDAVLLARMRKLVKGMK